MRRVLKLILLFFIFFTIGSWIANSLISEAQQEKKKYTEIKVFNVYRIISLKLEVKCDYEDGKYKFYKIINLPKNSNIIIKTPSDMKLCEVWPMDIKLF